MYFIIIITISVDIWPDLERPSYQIILIYVPSLYDRMCQATKGSLPTYEV